MVVVEWWSNSNYWIPFCCVIELFECMSLWDCSLQLAVTVGSLLITNEIVAKRNYQMQMPGKWQ